MSQSPLPAGAGPFDPDLSGIDPGLMDAFITAMSRAQEVIGEQSRAIRAELDRVGANASALGPVGETDDWVGEQVRRLRVRNERIRGRVPDWLPGMVEYDEAAMPFVSREEARREGAALAALYRRYTTDAEGKVIGDDLRERHRDLLARMLRRGGDGDFAAALFAGLGAAGTLALPRDIAGFTRHSPISAGVTTKEQALGELSRMFGAATVAGGRAPGFAKVMDDLRRGDEGADRDALSWLVSKGDLPSEWLAAVVRANVILPMLSRTSRPEDITLGTTARFLDALAADPAAARSSVNGVLRHWTTQPAVPALTAYRGPSVRGVLTMLSRHVSGDGRTSGAFGRMLAAASGAYDERDGAHSADAARFAFEVITAAPGFATHDAMRRHLAEIGGAYATEFAASADAMDPDAREPSRFGRFDDNLPGTEPAFRLSLTDGYRYLQTFTDTNAHMEPFDRGMAALTQRLFTEGVHLDKARIANPPPNDLQAQSAVEQVFSRLGMVSGMEFAAMKVVRGTADLREKDDYESFTKALDKGMDMALLVVPAGGVPSAAAWMAFSWLIKDGLGAALEPEARLPLVNEKEITQTRAVLYEIAAGLVAKGYTMGEAPVRFKPPADPLIVDARGRLRPFSEIGKDREKTGAFLRWLKENGSIEDEADRRAFGKLVSGAATRFSGAKDRVEESLSSVDPHLKKVITGDGG
ncbi:hypothetical protein [Nonomuraea lactucae]|uniref:hypothetical protein n=1 Tax=Nonomuraea lactucae TaxID=2249762 RepID=UPI000DE33D9C|nr:hypothetical protein [Nonomuraea lactucae]